MYWKIFINDYLNNKKVVEFHFFKFAIVAVIVPFFLWVHFFLFPSKMKELLPFDHLTQNHLKNLTLKQYLNIYPVIVEHKTYSSPKENQIPVYSSITSGGSGGITKDTGFHTLSNTDEFFLSYNTIDNITESNNKNKKNNSDVKLEEANSELKQSINTTQNTLDKKKQFSKDQNLENDLETLPMKIPANYRFRNDFALRWDNSPQFAIASIELKGYKYFRDMLRQIRENFSPPGLNLMWRDNAGVVISQPIKPQVVSVLFLLDYDGTVRDVKIVSSMGQKPVDEACIRVLLNQNFGEPPPEIFEHGNIFGINFIFPPVY